MSADVSELTRIPPMSADMVRTSNGAEPYICLELTEDFVDSISVHSSDEAAPYMCSEPNPTSARSRTLHLLGAEPYICSELNPTSARTLLTLYPSIPVTEPNPASARSRTPHLLGAEPYICSDLTADLLTPFQ
uniref:Uncharacterized protein n=1 Tax=Branchiostoma floridae TaxID=7739 RepID=C3YA76_BRAFL|eukprot:XP_002606614.1 hypothetical protein BRAFLDRAFT_72638 [Branchiostoma floridae]